MVTILDLLEQAKFDTPLEKMIEQIFIYYPITLEAKDIQRAFHAHFADKHFKTKAPPVVYIPVTALPLDALVEIEVWATQ